MSHPSDRRPQSRSPQSRGPQGRSPRPPGDRPRSRRFDRRDEPRSEAGKPAGRPDPWRPRRPYAPSSEERGGERRERPYTPRPLDRRGARGERGERPQRSAGVESRGGPGGPRFAPPRSTPSRSLSARSSNTRSAPQRGRWERPQPGLQGRRWEGPRGPREQLAPAPEAAAAAESFAAAAPSDLIWGRHATQAALESGRPIHRIWCTPEMRFSPRFLQLLREAKASGVLLEEVTWARLGQISGGAVHQGIVLQPAAAETLDLASLIEGCSDLGEPPLLMAVDGLTDPHNLGAIVRSAEALGAHGLVLPQRRNAGLTGSVAKVAAGALEHLPVARVVNLNRSLEALKQEGYRVVGLAAEGNVTLEDADLAGPLVVVTGSEAEGLSMLTRRSCDQLIRIPLRGSTPSLNASVATALLLYEVARRSWMAGLHGTAPAPRIVRPALPLPVPEPESESESESGPGPESQLLPDAPEPEDGAGQSPPLQGLSGGDDQAIQETGLQDPAPQAPFAQDPAAQNEFFQDSVSQEAAWPEPPQGLEDASADPALPGGSAAPIRFEDDIRL